MRSKVTIERINASKPTMSRLTAIKFVEPYISETGKKDTAVLCKCECGNDKVYRARLVMYTTKSCGCIQAGEYPQKLQKSYYSMMGRCYNKSLTAYKWYGKIGVVVCDDWIKDKTSFLKWALSNGYNDNLQLDKDIKGNGLLYSPNTCCFVTQKENNRARKFLKRYLFNGKSMILSEISDITGIKIGLLYQNIHRGGKTIEEAVDTPFFNEIKRNIRMALVNAPSMETEEYKNKMRKAKLILKEIISL